MDSLQLNLPSDVWLKYTVKFSWNNGNGDVIVPYYPTLEIIIPGQTFPLGCWCQATSIPLMLVSAVVKDWDKQSVTDLLC